MIFQSLMFNGVALLGEKFFPILVEIIYIHGFLLFPGINCCLGTVVVTFMKKNKGQSIDDVLDFSEKSETDGIKDQRRF